MLIDKYFAHRRADSHRFGATHSLKKYPFAKSDVQRILQMQCTSLPQMIVKYITHKEG
jgi:hypothetical protein